MITDYFKKKQEISNVKDNNYILPHLYFLYFIQFIFLFLTVCEIGSINVLNIKITNLEKVIKEHKVISCTHTSKKE